MQYRDIEPKIIIEPLLREKINIPCEEINVYCFNGLPKIFIRFYDNETMSIWDEKFNSIDNIFNFKEKLVKGEIETAIKKAVNLSKKLSKDFNFVRVDWILYKNKLYFGELTFTPYSGFIKFSNQTYNLKLGKMINLKGNKND